MEQDLLHLLRNPGLLPSHILDLLTRIAGRADELSMPSYLVGGAVRDLLLERRVLDIDIVVEGDAIKLGRILQGNFGGKLVLHPIFHTATWVVNDMDAIDLITARSETYLTAGALPAITPSTIQADLERRDFTINAMAIRLNVGHYGELIDLFNSQLDLEQGVIRTLHPRSFIDDPTRILRAIRYEQRYGFRIDGKTQDHINAESLGILAKLSGERIRHEFDLIFEEAQSMQMMVRAGELGLMRAFSPSLPKFSPEYVLLLESIPASEFELPIERDLLGKLLWFMDSSPEQVKELARRLDFSRRLSETCLAAVELNKDVSMMAANSKPSAWTERLEKAPLMAVYAVWLVSRQGSLKEYLLTWRHVHPQTTGRHLKGLGLSPGPRFKLILGRLRSAWLDGEVKTEEEEKELLRSLL